MGVNKKIIETEAQVTVEDTFNVVTYTGNGSTQSITGVGFQPDLVWIKKRSGTQVHNLYDSVRGVSKVLYSDLTNAEGTVTSISSFDTGGFTLGDGGADTNANGSDYVAWCWKAGGTAVTDSSADITADISANTDAGFSIVKYTGNSTANQTIPHGLDSSPTLIIIKCLNNSTKWWGVNSTSLNTNSILRLDSTLAEIADSGNYITMGNSSTFTVQDGSIVNGSLNYIAYCFHSVSGNSDFGSYSGNNTGQTITTGFQPDFLMLKKTNVTSEWWIMDSVRGTTNNLEANTSDAENTGISGAPTFVSTGFNFSGSTFNETGTDWIYVAFKIN